MNFFEQEMKIMFGNADCFSPPVYHNKTFLAKIEDDLLVKLEFVETKIQSHYDAIRLTLINRTEGMVDRQVFKFSDVLGPYVGSRSAPMDYHIWDHDNTPLWYTPITYDQKMDAAERVMEYIYLYLPQTNEYGIELE